MRHKLCASRTVHIMYSSGTNCMLWSAGECVSASITNYIYHELYTSRTLHIIYQLQAVQSAMVPFIVYITDCICHEQYVSQTLYISPVRQSSACCGARWCASSLEARWCWQEYRGGGGGRRVQDARSRVHGSGASPVTTNMAAAPRAASPAPPAW